jgi:DNA polymerase I-like protein with 3'-5' exonuclease and polymerase domains
MVWVVDDSSHGKAGGASARFFDAVDHSVSASDSIVAFDCEGVNLSRAGSVELVSLQFPGIDCLFLIDIGKNGNSTFRQKRIDALKKLFECKTIQKIIHDCRMDCDALYHHCGIELVNVHDTSCFHEVITGNPDKNLNDVLSHNCVNVNAVRDKSVYKNNPTFWASRPLTAKMIDWASSDVDKLLLVASKQVDALKDRGISQMEMAKQKSTEFTTVARDMSLAQGLQVSSPGLFIGRGGSNLRNLQRRTGTKIYQEDRQHSNTWMVFYPTASALASVKRAMDS